MFGWWLSRRAKDAYGTPRGGKWQSVRAAHLKRQPSCQACGKTKDLEVHHKQSFHEHPELEYDPDNLWTLCGDPCHIVFGHCGNFMWINTRVEEDCARHLESVRRAKSQGE